MMKMVEMMMMMMVMVTMAIITTITKYQDYITLVQQQCNNITKRKDNMLQIIHFYFYFTILQHRINNNKYNKKT